MGLKHKKEASIETASKFFFLSKTICSFAALYVGGRGGQYY